MLTFLKRIPKKELKSLKNETLTTIKTFYEFHTT